MFNMEWLAQYPLLINLLTHGALLIEFALAFWLWFRPTRRWAILAGVALHLGIRPILNVPGFGETLIATYLVFLDPDEFNALIRCLDPRAWLARLGMRTPSLAFWGRLDRPPGFKACTSSSFRLIGRSPDRVRGDHRGVDAVVTHSTRTKRSDSRQFPDALRLVGKRGDQVSTPALLVVGVVEPGATRSRPAARSRVRRARGASLARLPPARPPGAVDQRECRFR